MRRSNSEMRELVEKDLRAAYSIADKMERHKAIDAAKDRVMGHFCAADVENPKYSKLQVAGVFKDLEAKIVRWNILDTGNRIDGRDVKTVRPIVCEVGVLPRTHGSALFTRGETQALVVATLGTGEDEQCDRRAAGHLQGIVPAALQLPAVLGRRDRPHRRSRPARDRPRQARLARDSSRSAGKDRVSRTRSAWSPRSPSRTARRRWRPCAAPRSR